MARPERAADGGLVYDVLNRANGRLTIFEDDADYEAFERILIEAIAIETIRVALKPRNLAL